MSVLGFTGPSRGLTSKQIVVVHRLFVHGHLHVLHHGDCIGGDYQANMIATELAAFRVAHPPINERFRAHAEVDEVRRPKEYLERDRDVAHDGRDGLVAAVTTYVEVVRSGEWATIRYARKFGRRIWIVYPDGTVKRERGQL